MNHEHPKQVAPGRQYGRKRMGRFVDRLFELGADRVLFAEEWGHQYTERLHYHAVVKAVASLGSRELRSAWRYSWGQSEMSLVHSLAAMTGYVVKYVLKGVSGAGSPEPSYFDFVDRAEQVRRMGGVTQRFYSAAGRASDKARDSAEIAAYRARVGREKEKAREWEQLRLDAHNMTAEQVEELQRTVEKQEEDREREWLIGPWRDLERERKGVRHGDGR